jgi:hypothetical protein
VVFRSATTHLIVAVLLACPFLCLSQGTAGAETPSTDGCRSGCGCCSHSTPASSKDCPGKQDSRQGSGACLCRGAVMDRHVVAPDPGHEISAFDVPPDIMFLVRQSLAAERSFSTERAGCHFSAAVSGRAVRALIASLLL